MSHPHSPYASAWLLWHHSTLRHLSHRGPILHRTVTVPARFRPSVARTEAMLAIPPAARGWVILAPGTADGSPAALASLAATLHRVGLGTLSLAAGTDRGGLTERTETLVEAARWLARQSVATAGSAAAPRLALAGQGADAAAVLAAAASGELACETILGVAGRYEGLDEAMVRGLRAPLRLVVGRDDETGLWQARQVLAWLPADRGHDLVLVAGTGEGLTPSGRRAARWLAGAWMLDHLDAREVAELAQLRMVCRLRLARGGLSLLSLSALVAAAWMGQPAPPPGAQAAPGRLWAGADLVASFGGRLPVLKLDAPLPGTIELSSLNGTNGFAANGGGAGGRAGSSVSDAGDINNDGFDDILVGEPLNISHGAFEGSAYLIYGGAAVAATVQLISLNGTNGFHIFGVTVSDRAGWSVSGAGDVNNDGFDDILIGAPLADTAGVNSNSGQSYVVFGGTALPASVELSALNGANGFRLNGIAMNDFSGSWVSGAGDVNNDGFDDILIGAYDANPNGTDSGQSYVVYGGTAVAATVQLSALNGANGFQVNGISTLDRAGVSVSSAGDFNNDGFDDVLIGAYGANPNGIRSGQSYVIYGGTALPATVELSGLNGTNGFRVNGITSDDRSGYSVSGAGDVNNDGFDDIIIGAFLASPNGQVAAGQSYVVYGGTGLPATVELSALNGTNGFYVNGVSSPDLSGRPVSGAGDVNQDGFDDILIGARFADPNGNESGQSYVVYGGAALPGTVELSTLNGTNGFNVNGITASDRSGSAVSGAGDVNNDGFDDILIGAEYADPHGVDGGQSYVVYGDGGVPLTPTPSATATNTSTSTPTGSPTSTPTGTSTGTPTSSPTSTATGTPTSSPTSTSTGTSTGTSTSSPTSTATGTPTSTPTNTPTSTTTNTPTNTPTSTTTNTPTNTPTPSPLTVSISDPLGCTDNADLLDVQVVVNNPGGDLFGATVLATLPPDLTGVAASCTFSGGTGACVVSPGDMTWTGDIPAGGTLTIDYQVQVGAGAGQGEELCIVTEFQAIDAEPLSVTECTSVDCPVSPTGVELRSFRAIGLADRALLVWETALEQDTLGFEVYRAAAAEGPWTRVNTALIPAEGSATGGQSYVLRDAPGPGAWHYRLEDVGAEGKRTLHPASVVQVGPEAEGRELFVPRAEAARAGRPVLAGTVLPDLPDDDRQFVVDLGLVRRDPDGRPDPLAQGLAQIESYLARLGLGTGWLVIFD